MVKHETDRESASTTRPLISLLKGLSSEAIIGVNQSVHEIQVGSDRYIPFPIQSSNWNSMFAMLTVRLFMAPIGCTISDPESYHTRICESS